MKSRALVAGVLALALGACRSGGVQEALPRYELATVFEGERSIDEASLREVVLAELARTESERPTKADIDDAAFAIELAYRKRGFPFVRVEYELIETPGAVTAARFTIDEGAEVHVSQLVLSGVAALDAGKAQKYFGAAAEGGIYDEDRLDAGVAALRLAYLEGGHLRVDVADPEVVFDAAGGQALVTVRVVEGPAFVVRDLAFAGGLPEFVPRERELAYGYLGAVFRPEMELALENSLREAYLGRGYPDVVVDVESRLEEESGDARLDVRTTPGERVTIRALVTRGNVRTKRDAIAGLVRIEPGDLYDPEAVREAFTALYSTGLFESLRLYLEGAGPERALVVEVEEGRSVQIRMEPGWGSYEGPRVLLGIEEGNFRGRAQRLSLEGTASLLAQSARLGWFDPNFLDTRFGAETTLFVERREEPSFEFDRIGASFFLRRRWSERWTSSFGYEIRPTNVNDHIQVNDGLQPPLPLDSTDEDDLTDDADVAVLSTSLVLDDRDNLLLPTRGRYARARLEYADDGIASHVEFVRAQLEFTRLFRLGQESVLASSVRTGVIAPQGQTSVIPLPERFFNGGEASVRSFQEDELGPVDGNGDPIGGEAATTLGIEFRRSITGNLAGALFADAGNVTAEVQDYLRFDDFRYALGFGVRYLLPVGPVRVDVGFNPDPEDGEDDYAIHFSVGFPF